MALVTLDQAKAQLGIDPEDADDDDELQRKADSISSVIEDYKGEVIEPRTISERVAVKRPDRFRLRRYPVISLTTLASLDGQTTYDVDNFDVDGETGIVEVLSGSIRGTLRAVYLAGYEDPPGNYVEGALIVLQHVWETQRGVSGIGSGVIGEEEMHARAGSAFTFPHKALEWLGAPGPRGA